MLQVTHCHHELQIDGFSGTDAAARVGLGDVALGLGDGTGDLCQQALAVDRCDGNGGFKGAGGLVRLFDGDETLAVLVLELLCH